MWTAQYPQIWFTFGPQTQGEYQIRSLLMAGATGARMTFSYGTPELQIERSKLVRRIASSIGRSIFLVADLQGEKCRLSRVIDNNNREVNEIPVNAEDLVILAQSNTGADHTINPPRLAVQNDQFLNSLEIGDSIVEGDGQLLLRVVDKQVGSVTCVVNSEGVLHPGRGLLVQSSNFQPAAITEKDRSDLNALVSSGAFDAVALSFVGSRNDIEEARSLMKTAGGMLPIIAKIETQLGIKNISDITQGADAIMAARGDLALTSPWIELPALMDEIVAVAKKHDKPWIIATQLVEGLERFAFPTRAEICDLARWITEGAYGAMLSYETAFGPRAEEAVQFVNHIVQRYKGYHLGVQSVSLQ